MDLFDPAKEGLPDGVAIDDVSTGAVDPDLIAAHADSVVEGEGVFRLPWGSKGEA